MALHHWVPQFILREFTDPDVPLIPGTEQRMTPFVWVFDLENQTWDRSSPKKIAAKKGYNSLVDEQGRRNDEVENVLSELEGQTAVIYRRKIAQFEPLDDDEKITVA